MTLIQVPPSIRQRLTEGLGQPLDAVVPTPCGDTCHGARVAVGHDLYFLKWRDDAPDGLFATEAASLNRLAAANLRVPAPLAWEDHADGSFLLMEYITPREREFDLNTFGRLMGERIAALHSCTWTHFGADSPAFLGLLPLDNTPTERWATFFVERRLRPLLTMATQAGTFDRRDLDKIARFVENVGKWLPDDLKPSLLHGNLMSTHYLIDSTASPVFIDPAAFWGDPEFDVACASFMGGFPATFFETWQELRPATTPNPMGHAPYHAWLLLWLTIEFGGRYRKDLMRMVNPFL